jgi:ABC-type branched-subunit amino acid transport system ATPase component
MTTPRQHWRLEKVAISDVLGFQGAKEFVFQGGLQVIEAPNHTGKTSLTMALLWGLTGVIPNLPRINKQSFRLTNKHAGENAKPLISVVLLHDDGRRMALHRAYRARPDLDADLTVEVDDKTYTGQQAQDIIFTELGLKPGSLEGCGVVLQDHRLGLITGKESDISDVINDMLGLYTLSQLVPALETASKDANELKKEVQQYIEVADPVAKWEERDQQLHNDFRDLENKAIDAGIAHEALDNPKGTALQELTTVAKLLKSPAPSAEANMPDEVERLRGELRSMRKASPVSGELAKLQSRKAELEQWARTANTLSKRFGTHSENLAVEATNGEMDKAKLDELIADKEAGLDKNKRTRQRLQQEQGFLTTSYDHLLARHDLKTCPLCLKVVEHKKLLADVKKRLEGQIANQLEDLQENDKALAKEKNAASARRKVIDELRQDHDKLVNAVSEFADQIKDTKLALGRCPKPEVLFLDPNARQRLIKFLAETSQAIASEQQSLDEARQQWEAAQAKQEAELFQPAEANINRVRDYLVPIIDAAEKIERHGKLRQKAEERQSGLKQLFDEATALAGQLKRVGSALSQHEEEAASSAVKAQLPQISRFFRQIACNPDYDGLTIQTSLSRDKVAYRIEATSSTLGNLNDAVGHVLSDGDLSSAGMALLLGLAAGKSHRLGFMVLDDPAQGMDETRQNNFATTLAKLDDKRQIIILTHQSGFAQALKHAGATQSKLAGWKLGKLSDG